MTKNQFLPPKVRRPRTELVAAAEQLTDVFNMVVAGSYRRQKDTIGDLDVLVPPERDFGEAIEEFTLLSGYEPLRSGPMKSEGIVEYRGNPLLINLWRVRDTNAWGAMLLFATGPFDLNIMMRSKAKGHTWTLSQYGLFDSQDKQLDIGGPRGEGWTDEQLEADIFRLLGLDYVSPKERETWRDHIGRPPKTTRFVRVASSDGVSYYNVEIDAHDKAIDCECKGFEYRHKCRHLVEAEAIARYESA